MELNDKVTQLEDEIKILKNEVQAVLLDLRESYLNNENPFSISGGVNAAQPIIINQPGPQPQSPEPDFQPHQEAPETSETDETEPPSTAAEPEPKADDMTLSADEPEEEPINLVSEPEPEPAIKTTPVSSPIMETRNFEIQTPAASRKEWRLNKDLPFSLSGSKSTGNKKSPVDLDNITGLAQWVEDAVNQLGPARTETALEISEMLGHIGPELKNIMIKFINPAITPDLEKVPTRDYLASLIELSNLLGRDNRSEAALLYILCQEHEK